MIMVATFLLVIITIAKGFKVEENPLFIFIESMLNLVIIADFLCRLRLIGARRFFGQQVNGNSTSRLWNWLDAIVVLGSFLCFLAIIFSSASSQTDTDYLEEVSEIVLLAIWALFQTLRVIFIAKRQRLAQQSAKTLIDFTHNIIVVDSEVNPNHRHNDSHSTDRPKNAVDEVIVFDMKQSDHTNKLKNSGSGKVIYGREGKHF